MPNLAERLRAKSREIREHEQNPIPKQVPENAAPTSTVTALSPVQTPPNPLPSADGHLMTTPPIVQIDPNTTLEERTVRFFTVITQGIPHVGDNPVMALLMRKMGPLLVGELHKLNHEQLEQAYKAMLISLAQVYSPTASAVVLDLKQSHVLIEEVEAAVGMRMGADDIALTDDVQTDAMPTLGPPPPALLPEATHDDDDPLVGVMIDGRTVAVRQSQLEAIKAAI